ncbi:MAG: acyl CoA:acetate/3-ketoacid CoA transferase [Thermodesulfobacteriota bacterium]|nr:acyl CoA:acetate/3-ketoacid CoA transferase [Thermodesulfobacteriota bacterium]
MKKNKIATAEEAIGVIQDGDVMAAAGFVGNGTPEELIIALEKRFLENGEPKNITLLFSSGLGDAKKRGLNRLAHKGLFKRVIAGHYGLMPKIGQMALDNEFEAYNFPQGILTNLYRAVAGRKPGVFSKVGLGTFVDPRIEGGKVNSKATEDLVEVVELAGEEWLFMKAFPINIALIRGTTADTTGNITMEKEILSLDTLSMATAVKNSGGYVIAQVERIAGRGTLSPKHVKVPGILVDFVVVARPENHMQTYATPYSPAYAGEIKIPLKSIPQLPLNERKIIARRAGLELRPYDIINLGIGVPEGVSNVANEEKILTYLTMTVEPGIVGGVPAGGLDFGAATNPEAIIDMPDQFNFYDGGGLDLTCLGMAQCDRYGNVNSSKFGPRLAGCGGFINISQNAKTVLFVGTFTAGGLEIAIEDDKLKIIKEGKVKKFVKDVEQITFSGRIGSQSGQTVLYITERCVFRLKDEKLELIEVAPGIDIQKEILPNMEFKPAIKAVSVMDRRIFQSRQMDIRPELLTLDIDERIQYDPETNTLRLNFKGLEIETADDIEIIRRVVEKKCKAAGQKVKAIVDYESFSIGEDLLDAYLDMGQYIIETYYEDVTRHTTSEALRAKLGDEFVKRGLTPSIYDTEEEAERILI